MTESNEQRIRSTYDGAPGRRLERIEEGRPADYVERNILIGREKLRSRLLAWLDPVSGLRILDAGCGPGGLSSELAAHGGLVTGVDLVPRFIERARRRAGGVDAEFVQGDFLTVLTSRSEEDRFDVVLLLELLEDYPHQERLRVLQRVLDSETPRVFLAFRPHDTGISGFWDLLSGDREGIDEIELLRWIHTTTRYRQNRQEIVRVRNYRVHLSELLHPSIDADRPAEPEPPRLWRP